ncbi:MAG: hypothetical protein M0Z29_04785 [Actinomycetota bacterium]|nr:hypothetical protein [Actinomycetota bacterium]
MKQSTIPGASADAFDAELDERGVFPDARGAVDACFAGEKSPSWGSMSHMATGPSDGEMVDHCIDEDRAFAVVGVVGISPGAWMT